MFNSIQASSPMYLTKNAPDMLTKFAPPEVGEKRTFALKFKPASAAELKALGDDIPEGYVAGWASTDSLDSYRHKIVGGAFSKSIARRGLSGPKGIKLLVGHNWDQLSGIIKKLEYRGNNLWIEAQMNLELSYAKDAYIAAKMNGGLSFSVGFMLEKYAIEGGSKDDNEEQWLRIDEGDLYEVSIVPFPGNEDATMEFIKSGGEQFTFTAAAFEKALILSGAAKSRNDARRFTQAAKQKGALFSKGGTDPVVVPPEIAPPVLALEKLQILANLTAQMKATLAR